jgi:hypothetical protein
MNEKARQGINEPRNSPSKAKWIFSGLLALAVLSFYYLIKGPTKRLTMTHAEWDEFVKLHPYEAPSLGASRSPCPFLNTFANHGILPRTGRNVTYDDYYRALTLAGASHQSSSLFLHTVFYAYKEIDPTQPIKSDWTPATSISLHQLGQHNMLEHDLSLSRLDVSKQPDFTVPNSDLVLSLLAMADQTSNMVGEEQVGDFRRKKWIEAIETKSNYHFGLLYQVKLEEKKSVGH